MPSTLTETARDHGPIALPETQTPATPAERQPPWRATEPVGAMAHLEVDARGASARLLESVPEVAGTLPALRSVAVVPNQTSAQDVRSIVQLHRRCRQQGWRFSADFTLNRAADACAALGRRPTSLGPILEMSRELRLAGVKVRWWVPVVPDLVYRLDALFSLARDERVEPVLVPCRLSATDGVPPEALDADGVRFVRDFLTYRLLEEERPHLSAKRQTLYEGLRDSLDRREVGYPGPLHPVAVLEVDDTGDAWRLRQELRPALMAPVGIEAHAQGEVEQSERGPAGPPVAEVAGVLAEGVWAVVEWAKTQAVRAGRPHRPGSASVLPRVLIIGAYGGEHIGDAAILGGVLMRIHRRYGTRHAILVSQRPDHTRHLVPMLDIPVEVTVEDYQQSTVGELLQRVDGVVFAGGPLMDLPKQLVKHLYTVSLARRQDKPFILEGIGAGPFVRWPSAWTARRLVRMADAISVRTSTDGQAPLVRGLRPQIGHDPAFDYLESRGADLTRLPDVDRQWLRRLLNDTDGRLVVGLNLRPIRPDYTSGTAPGRRVEHTRFIETRFEERLAEGLRRFHKASSRPPCFIFFPMNAIQFGRSDLRSAYRLSRLLRGDVDLRIWEGDASLDGIVALLRRMDVAITMRFHATIFALAQRCRVVGIDYRVGKRDKVAALLGDFGRGADCARVDEMTAEWVFQRLSDLSG